MFIILPPTSDSVGMFDYGLIAIGHFCCLYHGCLYHDYAV
jgi:hypothetical protein